jgi:hypothetical protein
MSLSTFGRASEAATSLQLLWVPDAEKLLRSGGAGVEQFAAGGEVKSGQLLQSVESSASESQQHLGTGFLALGELFEIDGAHGYLREWQW